MQKLSGISGLQLTSLRPGLLEGLRGALSVEVFKAGLASLGLLKLFVFFWFSGRFGLCSKIKIC